MYSRALLYTFLYTCELIYCTLITIGIDFHDFLLNFWYLSKDIHSRALSLGLLLFEGSIPHNYLMIDPGQDEHFIDTFFTEISVMDF